VLDLLCRELELTPEEVSVIDAPLDLGGLWALYDLPRDELKYPPWRGVVPPGLEGDDIFADIRAGDVLVHLPYESFAASVEAFVAAAARDPRVLAIKQTLYRAGGDEAGIVASLAKAAREGKQVVTLVELKARFDEQANIERARSLEQAGVHVVYGLVGLKTHCKVLLVVRQEADGIRRYCHVGTGNYNPKTATLYEDLGVFSADPALGADLSELFNYLTGYGRPRALRRLIVAPSSLRPELTQRISDQGRSGGRIVMKMNALVDPELIDALYDAAQRGAEIDLLIRGICCLRPGVSGLSDRIRVRSIVGRFLEHSRIFRFGPNDGSAEYLIGSADLMPRNLDRRIEALLTVTGRELQARLDEILAVGLADDVGAWTLQPDGTWRTVPTGTEIDLQRRLQELALARVQARADQAQAADA
jgi:polyphosphate kinase